jgi:HK97 family phage major capsid protein
MPALPTLTKDSTIEDVRNAARDAAGTLLEMRSVPKDKRADTHEVEAREVIDFIHDLDIIEKGLAAGERAKAPATEGRGAKGPRGFGAELTDDEVRSIGAQVVDSDNYRDWVKDRRGPFVTEVRNLIGGFTAGGFQSGANLFQPVGSPALAQGSIQRRRAFVRDLMSVQSTGLRVVPYLREQNQVTNETGAQMTSEGSAKPEVTATFEQYSAIIEKIAAWIPVTDEIIADAPTLQGYIETRLDYMLMIREEQQVLAGTGSTPQIQGVKTLSGVQTQGAVAGDFAATIGQAIGKVENVDGEADGVVCNPLDYWTAATKRFANQFDNGFGAGAPASVPQITWGVPTVRTRTVATTQAWVASWALGSTLFDRQETTIRVGDQHNDNFIRNLLVVLAEKRIGVAWHRANLFVDTTVPNT